MSNYTRLYKYGKRTRDLLGVVLNFILVFYILAAFLMKQLFHSRWLDIR